jgi:hypothetical protein
MAKYSPSGSPPEVTARIFWLRNRPRGTPMTEEEWARERATVLDAEPAFGDGREENHLEHANTLFGWCFPCASQEYTSNKIR